MSVAKCAHVGWVRRAKGGRGEGEAREAIKLTETLATPSSDPATPSTSDSMPSLTRKPFVPYCNTGVINIFHTPKNCLLCARRTDNFRCIGEAILQACHRLSLSKRLRQDTRQVSTPLLLPVIVRDYRQTTKFLSEFNYRFSKRRLLFYKVTRRVRFDVDSTVKKLQATSASSSLRVSTRLIMPI